MNNTVVKYALNGPRVVEKRFVKNASGRYVLQYRLGNVKVSNMNQMTNNKNNFKMVAGKNIMRATPNALMGPSMGSYETMAPYKRVDVRNKTMVLNVLNKGC